MVLGPGAGDEATPQFLVYHNGIWRAAAPGASPGSVKVAREKVNRQIGEMMDKVGSSESVAALPDLSRFLEAVFGGLYKLIVPTDIHRLLGEAARPDGDEATPTLRIHLDSQAEWIPWEILHDGTDFLGLRFQVARLPIVVGIPGPDAVGPRLVQRVDSLLGEDVLDPRTEQLFKTWQEMFSRLAESAQLRRCPDPCREPPNWPSIAEVTEAWLSDILHLTCHGGLRDGNGQFYWTLNRKNIWTEYYSISRDFVETLKVHASRPLVFANACASASAVDRSSGVGLTPGLGTQFFASGASAFIGTFAPVTKRLAFEFACEFYRRLLDEGLPVGRALRETKRHFQEAKEKDPSWLFYCLYGLPETCFRVQPGATGPGGSA
jgi:hypothetical protein